MDDAPRSSICGSDSFVCLFKSCGYDFFKNVIHSTSPGDTDISCRSSENSFFLINQLIVRVSDGREFCSAVWAFRIAVMNYVIHVEVGKAPPFEF